jgi:hypothetical protein
MNFSNSNFGSWSAESIRRDVDRIQRELYASNPLAGVDVRISQFCDDMPRMTPNPEFAKLMTDEFVAELRDWMLQFFGTEDKIFSIDNGRTIICGPKTMRRLQREAA